MNTNSYEISGTRHTTFNPRARMHKTITLSNWPTSKRPTRNEEVTYNAWDYWTQTTTLQSRLQEAYHKAFLLRQVLVPDLVPMILEHAEDFDQARYCKEYNLAVPKAESPCTYLITPPIKSPVRLQHPVRKVVFTIKARDEGLDLNVGQSHFTAGIIRGGDLNRESEIDDGGLHCTEESVSATLFLERKVAKNSSASDFYETHVVEWSCNSDDPEEAAWVGSLKALDCIAVRAWAQWASFENRVSSAEVAIHLAAVVK